MFINWLDYRKTSNHIILMRMMMIREHTLFGTRFPTFLQNANLFGHVAQTTNDLLIPIVESEDGIRDVYFLAELLDQDLCSSQVMSRDTWIEVMNCLELKATVNKIKPCRAVNIHCGAQHLLRERFVHTQVCSRHGEVRECDLDVEWCSDHVRY